MQIGAVSQSTDKLDIFVSDANGSILQGSWQPGGSWYFRFTRSFTGTKKSLDAFGYPAVLGGDAEREAEGTTNLIDSIERKERAMSDPNGRGTTAAQEHGRTAAAPIQTGSTDTRTCLW